MTPLDTFRSIWIPQERRSLTNRRAVERRMAVFPVPVERRGGRRRSGVERRESATGHLRNALQVLQELKREAGFRGEDEQRLDSAIRRLWLAVAEVERISR